MALANVATPYDVFTDTSGEIISSGSVYIGVANQDPETNPITCYWDAAGTIVASQPLQVVNGYIVNTGTPAQVFVNSDYSIRLYSQATIQWTFLNILAKTLSGAAGGDLTGSYPNPQIAVSAVTTSKLADHAVTNAKIAVGGNNTVKATIGAAVVDQNMTDLTAALNAFTGDSGSGGLKGLVPAPSAGSATANKFLKADGSFSLIDLSKQILDWITNSDGSYCQIGSIIIQVGRKTAVPYVTPTAVTFPIAFPTACLKVLVSPYVNAPSPPDSIIPYTTGALTTTQFNIYTFDNTNHPNCDIDWIALGH